MFNFFQYFGLHTDITMTDKVHANKKANSLVLTVLQRYLATRSFSTKNEKIDKLAHCLHR
jgi:hypothetical protein